MSKPLWSVVLACTSLLACNNPAPLSDARGAAGASAALDRRIGPCRLAEPGTTVVPEQTRGLYAARADAASSPTYGAQRAGSYALRVELDVYTQTDASVVAAENDPGRGTATLLLRADIDEAQAVELRLCGLDLPASYAYASSKVTQFWLPDEVWDRPSMPRWKSRLHTSRESSQLELALPLLLGVSLSEPGAAWPSYEQTLELDCGDGQRGKACFPDHDGDGQPGVSLHARAEGEPSDAPYPACGEWHHAAPSSDSAAWLSHAASEPERSFVGLRTALQLFLRPSDASGEGTGNAKAADIVTRVLDCQLAGDEPCSERQAMVVDARSPIFHVLAEGETPPESFRDSRAFIDEALDRSASRGGQLAFTRLPDSSAATCAPVRASFAR
jgi:hypothetical protein